LVFSSWTSRFVYQKQSTTPLKFLHCNLIDYEYFDSLSCSAKGLLFIPLEEGRVSVINLNENLENSKYLKFKDISRRVKKLIKSPYSDLLYVIDNSTVLEIGFASGFF